MIKRCMYCGKEFAAKNGNIGFCSNDCCRAHINKWRRIRYQRLHKPPQSRRCIICGREFQPNTYRQLICAPECKRKRNRQNEAKCRQRQRAGLTHKRPPRYEGYLDYLERLEETYGALPNGRIKRMILDWSKGDEADIEY